MVPQIWNVTDKIFSQFGPKKSKFRKTEKNTWRYHHFTQV